MLEDAAGIRRVILCCGYCDLRKGILGLAQIVGTTYKLNPYEQGTLFLFCGKRADRMKAILWEEDGFLLLYKVLTGYKYQWPRTAAEVRRLTRTQYARLLEGLEIEKKVFSPPKEFF